MITRCGFYGFVFLLKCTLSAIMQKFRIRVRTQLIGYEINLLEKVWQYIYIYSVYITARWVVKRIGFYETWSRDVVVFIRIVLKVSSFSAIMQKLRIRARTQLIGYEIKLLNKVWQYIHLYIYIYRERDFHNK